MYKKTILIISLLAVFLLSACGTKATPSNASPETTAGVGADSDLPILSKLVVGTFQLIDSDTPITSGQAEEMIILWKAYIELQTRDTTADQEITDLLDQIDSLFTSDQQAAIEAMDLTSQNVMAMVQEVGVQTNQKRSSSSQSTSSSTDGMPGGGPGGGGMPPDMMMAAGGGMEGGFVPGSGSSATPSTEQLAACQGTGARMEAVTIMLIEPLISKLETIQPAN